MDLGKKKFSIRKKHGRNHRLIRVSKTASPASHDQRAAL